MAMGLRVANGPGCRREWICICHHGVRLSCALYRGGPFSSHAKWTDRAQLASPAPVTFVIIPPSGLCSDLRATPSCNGKADASDLGDDRGLAALREAAADEVGTYPFPIYGPFPLALNPNPDLCRSEAYFDDFGDTSRSDRWKLTWRGTALSNPNTAAINSAMRASNDSASDTRPRCGRIQRTPNIGVRNISHRREFPLE